MGPASKRPLHDTRRSDSKTRRKRSRSRKKPRRKRSTSRVKNRRKRSCSMGRKEKNDRTSRRLLSPPDPLRTVSDRNCEARNPVRDAGRQNEGSGATQQESLSPMKKREPLGGSVPVRQPQKHPRPIPIDRQVKLVVQGNVGASADEVPAVVVSGCGCKGPDDKAVEEEDQKHDSSQPTNFIFSWGKVENERKIEKKRDEPEASADVSTVDPVSAEGGKTRKDVHGPGVQDSSHSSFDEAFVGTGQGIGDLHTVSATAVDSQVRDAREECDQRASAATVTLCPQEESSSGTNEDTIFFEDEEEEEKDGEDAEGEQPEEVSSKGLGDENGTGTSTEKGQGQGEGPEEDVVVVVDTEEENETEKEKEMEHDRGIEADRQNEKGQEAAKVQESKKWAGIDMGQDCPPEEKEEATDKQKHEVAPEAEFGRMIRVRQTTLEFADACHQANQSFEKVVQAWQEEFNEKKALRQNLVDLEAILQAQCAETENARNQISELEDKVQSAEQENNTLKRFVCELQDTIRSQREKEGKLRQGVLEAGARAAKEKAAAWLLQGREIRTTSGLLNELELWRQRANFVLQINPREFMIQAAQAALRKLIPPGHEVPCSSMRQAIVHEVHSITNVELWEQYQRRRNSIANSLLGRPHCPWASEISPNITALQECFPHIEVNSDANEVLLLHGTKEDCLDHIFRQGFDERLSKRNLYGRGVYFAIDSCKAKQYCEDGWNESGMCIIVARVLLGHFHYAEGAMQHVERPPDVEGFGVPHDSIVARPGIPKGIGKGGKCKLQVHHEFIVPRGDLQVYPELIIRFKTT